MMWIVVLTAALLFILFSSCLMNGEHRWQTRETIERNPDSGESETADKKGHRERLQQQHTKQRPLHFYYWYKQRCIVNADIGEESRTISYGMYYTTTKPDCRAIGVSTWFIDEPTPARINSTRCWSNRNSRKTDSRKTTSTGDYYKVINTSAIDGHQLDVLWGFAPVFFCQFQRRGAEKIEAKNTQTQILVQKNRALYSWPIFVCFCFFQIFAGYCVTPEMSMIYKREKKKRDFKDSRRDQYISLRAFILSFVTVVITRDCIIEFTRDVVRVLELPK